MPPADHMIITVIAALLSIGVFISALGVAAALRDACPNSGSCAREPVPGMAAESRAMYEAVRREIASTRKRVEINENRYNTPQHVKLGAERLNTLKKLATPAGFEPATLSLEG